MKTIAVITREGSGLTDYGHAALAVGNDNGNYTRYDLGAAGAGGDYNRLAGQFNSLVSASLALSYMGACCYVASQIDLGDHGTSIFAASIYGTLVAPQRASLVVDDNLQ